MKATHARNLLAAALICTLALTSISALFAQAAATDDKAQTPATQTSPPGSGQTAAKHVNLPPPNPFVMPDVGKSFIHFDVANTDTTPHASWMGTHVVKPEQVQYTPGNLVDVAYAFRRYPDGSEALIYSGVSSVGKVRIDGGRFEVVDVLVMPGFEQFYLAPDEVRRGLAEMDAAGMDEEKMLKPFRAMIRRAKVDKTTFAYGAYTVLDRDGFYYAAYDTKIFKIADARPDDATSALKIVATVDVRDRLPTEYRSKVTRMLGLSMTYDGYVAIAMPGLIAVTGRDFKEFYHAVIPDENVDNGIAIDEKGGIYVVTDKQMRKVVWTGKKLSLDEADGAWAAPYDIGAPKPQAISRGSGATPTLMGFGDDPDKLVVIPDAADTVKIVAFWRDEIPADAKQKPGAKSPRIADQIELSIPAIGTVEWSHHVHGYGVLAMNSTFPDPVRTAEDGDQWLQVTLLTMAHTRKGPRGVEKFEWNARENKFERRWRNDAQLQWGLHPVSIPNNSVHLTVSENGVFKLVGLDWDSGKAVADITLGTTQVQRRRRLHAAAAERRPLRLGLLRSGADPEGAEPREVTKPIKHRKETRMTTTPTTETTTNIIHRQILMAAALVGALIAINGSAFAQSTRWDELSKLPFKDNLPTPETSARLYDEVQFQRAVQVYLWAQPAMNMVAMRDAQAAAFGAGNNVLAIWKGRLDAKTLLSTGNPDVIYALAFLDLKDGPIVVDLPPQMQGILDDFWHRPLTDVGLPGPDQGKGGKYLLLPPGYADKAPDGYYVLKSPTYGVFVFLRSFLVDGKTDAGVKVMEQTRIYPLAQKDNPPAMKFPNASIKAADYLIKRDYSVFESLAAFINHEPVAPEDMYMRGMAASLGIVKGRPFQPDAKMKAMLNTAAGIAFKMASVALFDTRHPDKLIYPDRKWEPPFLGGSPVFRKDSYADLDALNAFFHLAFSTSESMVIAMPGKGSQYLLGYRDADGDLLSGDKSYRLHVPANVPAANYWSVVLYDSDTRSLLDNGEPFPSVASNTNLKPNADGSSDIYFGPTAPRNANANWIKTVPGRAYFAGLRLYAPTQAFFAKVWKPGDIEKVK